MTDLEKDGFLFVVLKLILEGRKGEIFLKAYSQVQVGEGCVKELRRFAGGYEWDSHLVYTRRLQGKYIV